MKQTILKAKDSERVSSIIVDHIHVPEEPPEMILVVGPCRTGTTALGNVFARFGIISYMQPIKSMRRAVEEGQIITDWTIDSAASVIFSKETLGAKTEAEFFDPIEELQRVGYPLDKIHLIGTCRDPRATLGSWVEMWGKVPMSGFVESFKLIDRILDRAENLGMNMTHYVQEAIGTNEPQLVIDRLLKRIQFPRRLSVATGADWKVGPAFGDQGSNIVFFDEPPVRFVKGVKEGDSYHFRLLIAHLTESQEKLLRQERIDNIFEKFAIRCEKDLGIQILER